MKKEGFRISTREYPEKIIFIRHVESVGNAASGKQAERELFTNNGNYSITEKGIAQAKATKQNFEKHYPGEFVFFSSPALRTRATQAIVTPDADPIIDSLLLEHYSGIWRHFDKTEITERFPDSHDLALDEIECFYLKKPTGGDSWFDTELEIRLFFEQQLRRLNGQQVCIFGHGRWFVILQFFLRHYHYEDYFGTTFPDIMKLKDFPGPENGSIWCIEKQRDTGVESRLVLREDLTINPMID